MSKQSTTTSYKGDVRLKLKLKNRTIELKKRNSGLLTLSKAFAMFLANSPGKDNLTPQYVDLQWIENPNSVSNINDLSNWVSFLTQPISISGLSYSLQDRAYAEKGELTYQPNWVATAAARIPYSQLSTHQTLLPSNLFRLYLLTNPLDELTDRRLCYVTITADELNKMSEGSELQIEWVLQLVHSPIQETP